ncbi:class I SAM-dependent methyltransferase [Polaromonas sp.]|uniref:class I SAM-dependent methyltransferase n=1 Tax=Polaromonas sp. TaxID=1869339 RepID=UPI0037529D65
MNAKTFYNNYIKTRPRLNTAILPFLIFLKFFVESIIAAPRQLLQIDFVRFVVCLPRYFLFYLLLRRRKFSAIISDANSKNTIEHNMRGVGELSAPRSHILIRPLLSIGWVKRNIESLRVLSIGPRVEGEIYNLMGYGFKRKNIFAIDLFSYSPLIDVGDMHSMQYENNSFDVVICGWVLGYSDNRELAAAEILRITKPGGIVAVGNAYVEFDSKIVSANVGVTYQIGSNEVLNSLDQIDEIFKIEPKDYIFKSDGSETKVMGDPMIAIFRKNGALNSL